MQHTALITGASSGIGKALATRCAALGWNLVLVARNEDQLTDLAQLLPVHSTIIPCDLSKAGGPSALCAQLDTEGIEISVLMNCAGFASHGSFTDLDLEKELNMIDVNVRAVIELTGRILPQMLERKSGRILNIASIAAFQPGPYMATYFATKAAVLSFSEALWEETRGTGVSVTCLCPGPTESNFVDRAGLTKSSLYSGKLSTTDQVADAGMKAVLYGKRLKVVGVKNRVFVLLAKFFPRRVVLHGSGVMLKTDQRQSVGRK